MNLVKKKNNFLIILIFRLFEVLLRRLKTYLRRKNSYFFKKNLTKN